MAVAAPPRQRPDQRYAEPAPLHRRLASSQTSAPDWAFQLGLGLCTWVEANVTAVTAGTWPFASRCCDRCDRCDRGLSTSLSGSRCRSPVLVGGALFRYCVCVCVCCVRKCVRGVPVCPCVLLL